MCAFDRTLATSDRVSRVRHTDVPAMNSSLSPHSAVSSQDRTHGPKLNTALFQYLYGLTRVPRAPRDAQGTLQGLCAQWISLSPHYVVTNAQSSHCQHTRDARERFELRRGRGAICISFWDHRGGLPCVFVCFEEPTHLKK